MRPTEKAPQGMESLHDSDVADWLDARPHCALLFWDPDDAACQRLRVRIEVVAAAADIPIGTIDVRSSALVAQALGVKSVPSLVVFRGGEVMDRVMGGAPESVLRDVLG